MNINHQNTMESYHLKVKARQDQLKKLTLDGFLELYDTILNSIENGLESGSIKWPDTVLFEAILKELNRRSKAINWSTRVWRKPEEYKRLRQCKARAQWLIRNWTVLGAMRGRMN